MTVRITLFRVEEANKLAAEIRPALEELVKLKGEFDGVQKQVDVLTLAAAGASESNPDAVALAALDARRKTMGATLGRGVQALHRKGCVLKDLDRGLVDFYAVAGDRLVFLCWQLGEPEVAHWHTLEGGFSTRQPLNRSELE
jgi:hypothetical protein